MRFFCGRNAGVDTAERYNRDACPYPQSVGDIRKSEYPLLEGTTYLDHAGTTPYPKSLVKCFEKEMNSHLFGNPHSQSPSSMQSTDVIESTRIQALRFFEADPEYFDLVFMANATAAIKLVAECMSDYAAKQGGLWYGYHRDSHTSLVGVRELATRGSTCFPNDQDLDNWLASQKISYDDNSVGLISYPGQSNMNGRRLPLHWPAVIRSSSTVNGSRELYSLLDAAALVASAPLDLSDHANAPDFTALSFYKIFGFPDLGALIVRKAAGHVFNHRRYFGGGTVDMIVNGNIGGSTQEDWYVRKATSIHEMLEDGTPAFHSVIALKHGLKEHKRLFGSMKNVSKHTAALAKMLYEQMSMLCHANGLPLCQIYKASSSTYGDSKTQAPTVAFSLRDSRDDLIGKSDFEALAILNNIQIRTGGLCNPGGIASYLDIAPAEMRENYEEGVRCGNEIDEMHGKPTGVIRVSLGAMSSEKDVITFLGFLRLFVDRTGRRSEEGKASKPEISIERAPARTAAPPSKLMFEIDTEKVPENLICPIADCRVRVLSREELSTHFQVHKINQKRMRYFWRSG